MGENLEVQIRKLQEYYWSEADPQGRGFVSLADLYRRAGNFSEARRILKDGLSRHDKVASGHVVMGWLHLDQDNPTQAEAAFRAALAVDPANIRALKGLGDILFRRGEIEETLELHRALHALDPLDREIPDRLAELERRVESQVRLQEAEALEEVLLSQEEPRVWEDREEVAESLDWEGASMQEDRSGVAEGAAPLLGDLPEAAEEEGGAGEAVAEEVEEEVRDSLGEEPADEPAEESGEVGEEPEDFPGPGAATGAGALATRTMGEIYLRQGLFSEARSVFETLLEKDPGNPDLLAMLRQAKDRMAGSPAAAAPEPLEVIPIAHLAPDLIVPIAHLAPDDVAAMALPAPDETIPVEDLAPDEVVSMEAIAPEVIVPVQTLAPEMVIPIEGLAPDFIVPIGALAPEPAPEDPTLNDFEAWLDDLQ